MHEWHTNTNKNPLNLISQFTGFKFTTDHSGPQTVTSIRLTGKILANEQDAITFVTNGSYGGRQAFLAAYTTKKLSKAYQNAYDSFVTKYNEFLKFKENLTIGYGRKASKVTCPSCESSISLKYGWKFKACPVCGSSKIISDSNWKTLETKHRLYVKAAENLAKEAEKNDVTFVCGIEWHC